MNSLAQQLGAEYPIFAFSHCRDVIIEVSRAGGFGVLGAVGFTPEQFEIELQLIDAAIPGKPYGIDIVIPAKDDVVEEADLQKLHDQLWQQIPAGHVEFAKSILTAAGVPELPAGEKHEGEYLTRSTASTARQHAEIGLRHPNVRLIANALGAPPEDLVKQIHDAGRLVAGLCGDPEHARRHVAAGVDIIVAQGSEGGGHTGLIGSVVLWPQVVEAVAPIPVLAAGGVATGGQMAAALALGAQGVWTGSVWLTTAEADLTDVQKRLLTEASSRDTVRSRSLTGKPCRMLKNDWTKAWDGPDSPGALPLPLQDMVAAEAVTRAKAYPEAAVTVTINPVGQVVGQLNRVRRSRDVFNTILEELADATERLNAQLGG
jgi:NAD(P)H-dependent flavin oxidoreductase YrpB (nitropropane dioxygenase family)